MWIDKTRFHLLRLHCRAALILAFIFIPAAANAQTTAFTYQGKLTDNGAPANGAYDLEFRLFDALTSGSQQGATVTVDDLTVSGGIFTVTLDFGAAAFPAANRWLEVSVRPGAGNGSFTLLAPRQAVTATPYAIHSLNADTATNATTAVNFSGTLTGDVVGNQGATQLANNAVTTNKLADGSVTDAKINAMAATKLTGPVPIVNGGTGITAAPSAAGQFLRSTAAGTWAVGTLAASDLPAGSSNYIRANPAFAQFANFDLVGNGAVSGTFSASQYNYNGFRLMSPGPSYNLYVGLGAGAANVGEANSFFGFQSGVVNTDGSFNAFLGSFAGYSNTLGTNNTFVGYRAGFSNTTASGNTFIGEHAGAANTASFNTFAGQGAGAANTSGSFNTFLGSLAGATNQTGQGNTLVGRTAGTATTGSDNTIMGAGAGAATTTGFANTFIGRSAGLANTTGNNNTMIGDNADVESSGLTHATAVGADAIVIASNQIQLGRIATDTIRIGDLTSASATHVCITGMNVLSTCSSSRRYKESIVDYKPGLQLLSQLRPVAFAWKADHRRDLGLIAEEVAAVEPLLVTYNKTGAIEGVKYDQLAVVLITAVKEQQKQIETLRTQNAALLARLRGVEKRLRKKGSSSWRPR